MSSFELEAIRQHQDPGPVTMLNLLKLRDQSLDGDGTGREAYDRYATVAVKLIRDRGGSVVWVGSVDHPALHEGGDVDWHMAQLVYYPSRGAFIDMVTSSEYLDANVHRVNGTEKHAIVACSTSYSSTFPSG